jgi:replicative DNA helicase
MAGAGDAEGGGGKLLPHSLDAEVSVLGAILLDNAVLGDLVQTVQSDHFYKSAHRHLFEAMIALYDRGQAIDFVTLRDELLKRGVLEKAGGVETIVSVAGAVPSPANCQDYAAIVKEKATLRALIDVSSDITRQAYECRGEVKELVDSAEARIFAIADKNETNEGTKISDVLLSTFKMIEDFHRNKGALTGLPTGFYDLDAMTCGLQPSELIVVAARPSMGKTTFCLNIAEHAAVELGKSVAIFSLETSKQQIAQNLLCSLARIDAHKLRRGEIPEADWSRLPDVAGRLHDAKIFVDDTPALSPLSLKAKARRLKAKYGLDLIVLDYLQLMESPMRGDGDSRQQEISAISRSLKMLARELNVSVIGISQLNRAVDSREDHRPRMSDLRESGAIEQDADLICFLFREEYYKQSDQNKGIAEVIIAKHRNGPTGSVKLNFMPEFLRFGNLAYETMASG